MSRLIISSSSETPETACTCAARLSRTRADDLTASLAAPALTASEVTALRQNSRMLDPPSSVCATSCRSANARAVPLDPGTCPIPAAIRFGSFWIVSFTVIVDASEPVKNVCIPNAASAPLVSSEKLIS